MELTDINKLITAASDAWAAARDEGYRNASLISLARQIQNEANTALSSYLSDNPAAKSDFVFFVGSGFISNEPDPENALRE
ncbi:TPA: hypothetical protein ACMEVV_001504 [Klebsiella quasipneumoniae subsp. quasipneumoniae]|uniref:hypothetical protein n=1 Tax=Klebsiella variicola TaxID=244366 RepID=UPI000A97F3AD|nr:hypothetical protein [Klebsiella variicola]HBZ7859216.1 hypothetical protein [Klebsiella variicola subsp. variicola]